jgi:hypothetical protein
VITIPKRGKGKMSHQKQLEFESALESFYQELMTIAETLPFKVSSRGWCYILEEYGLTKGSFESAQDLINEGRKSGQLPIDFTALDGSRAFDCAEIVDNTSPEAEASYIMDSARRGHLNYKPISFWDYQPCYLELMVEKIDLKSMFHNQCQRYFIPVANAKGWSDINMRNESIQRFKAMEEQGKQVVLLYCGDFDPAGINISTQLKKNLGDLEKATGWNPNSLIVDRFGLNYDFIQDHNLSWVDNIETGSGKDLSSPNHPDHHKAWVQNYITEYGVRKVEANALITRIEAGQALFQEILMKYLDMEGIDAYQSDLIQEQAKVAELVKRLMRDAA